MEGSTTANCKFFEQRGPWGEQFRTDIYIYIELTGLNEVSLVQVSFCENTE